MPYGRMRMKTTKINPRSPYGRLLLEKQEVERLCELQEQQIAAEWQYVQNNAGRLLMSGFASVFFRGRPDGSGHESGGSGKKLMVLAWQLARPLLLRWAAGAGWRLIRSMFVQKRRN